MSAAGAAPEESELAPAACPAPPERRREIASMVRQQGVVTVTELADVFGVSRVTVRKDLRQLAHDGALHRFHGGAVASS